MSPVKVVVHPLSTNVARVLVALEEVGAKYELVTVDFLAGENRVPDHVARNVLIRDFLIFIFFKLMIMLRLSSHKIQFPTTSRGM
jgi:hypothetical protein